MLVNRIIRQGGRRYCSATVEWKAGQAAEMKSHGSRWTPVTISKVLDGEQLLVVANLNGKPIQVSNNILRPRQRINVDHIKKCIHAAYKLTVVSCLTLFPAWAFAYFYMFGESFWEYTPIQIRQAEFDPTYEEDLIEGRLPIGNLSLPDYEGK